MHSLPKLNNIEAFSAWRADPVAMPAGGARHRAQSRLAACAIRICSRPAPISLSGSTTRLILKIFPPLLRGQFVSERASLSQLRGRLSVPIPEIVLEGERDGWPYLVITRLAGVLGTRGLAALPEDQKERVLAQIGETIAEVQRVPPGGLSEHRAALGRSSCPADRRMPGAA